MDHFPNIHYLCLRVEQTRICYALADLTSKLKAHKQHLSCQESEVAQTRIEKNDSLWDYRWTH